jgi:hypothetical protein
VYDKVVQLEDDIDKKQSTLVLSYNTKRNIVRLKRILKLTRKLYGPPPDADAVPDAVPTV